MALAQYLTKKETHKQTIELAVADGPHYNADFNEYEIWLNGQVIGYAGTNAAAWRIYHDELHYQKVHFDRCPEYSILVACGEYTEVMTYGMEARG